MRKILFFIPFIISLIILIVTVVLAYNHIRTDRNISCLAVQSTTHGDLYMHGSFEFLFNNGRGSLKINGNTEFAGRVNIVSRQIFFIYTRFGSDFILKSQQIQLMNNGDTAIANKDFNHHFPVFFSQEEKQLALTIRQDRIENLVMYFADVPAFYCEPKK